MTERRTRGQGFIRDPAQAVAAAKCILARRYAGVVPGGFHERACAFEEMPTEYLLEKVIEFNVWAGFKVGNERHDPEHTPISTLQPRVEGWDRLPASEQLRQVRAAQGYESQS